jgi:hypothetical protein
MAIGSAAIYYTFNSCLPENVVQSTATDDDNIFIIPKSKLIGYGSQVFPIFPDITSTDVEYDGLLLALHQLQLYLVTSTHCHKLISSSSFT